MAILTEPIGSIPRPQALIEAIAKRDGTDPVLEPLYEEAIRDTIERFEATGSPVITDGEQRKYHNFWTYSVHGLPNTAPDGFKIPFAAGHTRRMPRLTGGPFRYKRHADSYLDVALRYAHVPVKQAVISPSALSLMYPADEISGYSREQFIEDLLQEHETEIRSCLAKGAHKVQIDFTEGRLAVKIDPSGDLLHRFIDLNNLALSRFSAEERQRIGVHTCPGGDRDSTHSADVDYAELLPSLFELKVGSFYIALAGESDRVCVLKIIKKHLKADQRVFVGVVAPIDPRLETPEEIRDRILEAAKYIPVEQLGSTDDCGFAPFCDDTSTSRDLAFAKIEARVLGTALASELIGGGLMQRNDDEEGQLRSVALQNAQSILLARQRAEDELVRAKEALQLKTQELAHSVAMLRATLESSTDGILVADRDGNVTDFNDTFLQLWQLSRSIMDLSGHRPIAKIISQNFKDPQQFLARIDEIYATAPPESFDTLELADGRVIERYSRIQFVDEQNVGRVWSLRDITERMRAQEALAKQSEQLRVTLASIGDAVITTDLQGRIAFLNEVAETLTGWKQSEAAGQPLEMVFHIVNEETRKPVENPAAKALREGAIVGLASHTVLVAKDGTDWPIDDSAAPIKDDRGNVAGSVLIFRDASKQRQAIQALQQSEARKAAVLDTALDCIISCDHEGKIIEFNPAAERTFGHRREDVIGREMSNIVIPPSLRPRHRNGMARFIKTRKSRILGQRLVMIGLRSDGREFPIEFSITQIPTNGLPVFTAYLRDITEQKRAEETTALLAAIVENSDDAIVSKTLDGVIRSWNVGAERLFGYSAVEAVGQSIELIIPPELRDEERAILERLRRGERVEHFETRRVSKQGQRLDISLTISPIRDSEGRIVGASKVARNITERKQAEDALRQLAAELSEADRRKNEFLAMLAHELRNPLAPIRNALQIVQLAADNGETVRSASKMMDRQVRQLVRLVDDLLDVSRINRGTIELRREFVAITPIIEQAIETCRPAIESSRHDLTVSLPPMPVYLDADPVRLAQVFSNLINNACKYSEREGCITIAVERVAGLPEHVEVRVKDTGIGIPAEMLPKIFEMFAQVDHSLERSQSGLGIGLTLVQRLVEMHKGSVSAFSEGLGRGSEFVVRLPILVDQEAPVVQPVGNDPPRVHSRRILVVDDNRDSARSLAMVLELTGHETQTAFDGLAALEAAATFRPDIVLLDIGMPKLNGYEAARRIREHPWGQKMVLVALSGWGQEEDRHKSKEAGFDGHMVKPVDHAALAKLLDETLS